MQLKSFLEFTKNDLSPIKSFSMKDNLNPKIWEGEKMKKDIKSKLLKIAKDFYKSTEVDAEIKDITLTGSLSNYNWSKYSDFDLHILIDFKEVNKDVDLVKELVDGKKTIWNLEHDIKIEGYEVEVYIQEHKEPHMSSGVFSILKNKWNVKPKKSDFKPDEKEIEEKSVSIMKQVDAIEKQSDKLKYEEVKKRVKKVWDKVKKLRQDALQKEGELSTGNLVFKLLRRNNYIGKIMKLKKDAYIKQFNENVGSFFDNDKLSDEKLDEIFGFNRNDVEDSVSNILDEIDIEVTTNFTVDGIFLSDESLDKGRLPKKDLQCRIDFWIDKETLETKHISVFTNSINDDNYKITKIQNIIEDKFSKSFYESIGYEVFFNKKRTNEIIFDVLSRQYVAAHALGPDKSNIILTIRINNIK